MKYGICLFALLASPLCADTLNLSVQASGSVQDNPVDGIGNTVLSLPFIGNFPASGNVYSAIVEKVIKPA